MDENTANNVFIGSRRNTRDARDCHVGNDVTCSNDTRELVGSMRHAETGEGQREYGLQGLC